MIIQRFLVHAKDARFELERVGRVSAALERLAEGGIDVVLLDLGLPDSHGGLDAFHQVHAKAPTVPIVVLTGEEDPELSLQAVRQGTHDYLSKAGLQSERLAQSILHAFEPHRKLEALQRQALSVGVRPQS